MILEGTLSVKAALSSGVRKVHEVWLDKDKSSRDFDYIKRLAQPKNIKVLFKSRDAIEVHTEKKSHGGCIALCEERSVESAEDLLTKPVEFILLVEGIEDPFNLGQIIRTAFASGAEAVLLNQRSWAHAENTLMRSSGGTYDQIRIAYLKDAETELPALKKHYTLAVSHRSKESVSYQNYPYPLPLILAVGGEMRGLSRSVLQQADAMIRIDYPKEVRVALNAVSASAVLCFEVYRNKQAV